MAAAETRGTKTFVPKKKKEAEVHMNAGLRRVRQLEGRTAERINNWNEHNGDMMFKNAKEIVRRPGGKRYVLACFISMIGGGGKCNGNRDLRTCLTKLDIPDNVIRWALKAADECEFSKEDHAAAHGSEERFKECFEFPA